LSTLKAVSTVVLAASLIAGCAGGGPSASGSAIASASLVAPSASAEASATPRPSPLAHFADTFDIGGGRMVFMECTGDGSPTVLFESGDTDDGRAWNQVLPGLVRQTRACTYDRLGTGRSDAATGCRRMDDIRRDLEALLKAAVVEPPYVLVGTSGGGYLVAGYALAHPGDVQGLMLVDTFPAIEFENHPPGLEFEISCENPQNVEHRDYAQVEHAAWDDRHAIGDIPITVITNDYSGYAENVDEENSIEGQRGWFELNPDGATQVIVTTGHNVPGNEPGVIVKEVTRILELARAR
jgi:alpha/beta hydrolase fold